jgi:alanine racemase
MTTVANPPSRAEAVVDTDAIAANVALVRARLSPGTGLMGVVKADGYGHGAVAAARSMLAGGADWLGVATPEEAMSLRAAGIGAPLLSWLSVPGEDAAPLVAAGVDIGVSTTWRLAEVVAAATLLGRPARVQLKVDTGLSRNGVTESELASLCAQLAGAVTAGRIEFTGLWSHLACADDPADPVTDAQLAAFVRATEVVRTAGLEVPMRHLANSAATLTRPDTHFDLVRAGIALYGYSPLRDGVSDLGLRPVMTVRARLAAVKRISAGAGVSYGHAWHAPADTVVGLVPVGYADGLPRSASPGAVAAVGNRRVPVVGRICMDQFVLDLGPDAGEQPGAEVVLFGGGPGEPSADDWAAAAGTISYEILTGIRGRVARRHVGAHADGASR